MFLDDHVGLLSCPKCGAGLSHSGESLRCENCVVKYPIQDGVVDFLSQSKVVDEEVILNAEKWAETWNGVEWDVAIDEYRLRNFPYLLSHISAAAGQVSLEIGAGPGFLSFLLAKEKGVFPVCLDIDLNILKTARHAFASRGIDGLFLRASMDSMPLHRNSVDLTMGVGVLEHMKDTQRIVDELYRITKSDGICFQTVPMFSALTILFFSIRYGTNTPLVWLNTLINFLHIKVLKKKRMAYGFERSFFISGLKEIFNNAGFRVLKSGHYDYNQTIAARVPVVRSIFRKLLRLRLGSTIPFGDIIYIEAVKL